MSTPKTRSYIIRKLHISENQLARLKEATIEDAPIKLRVSPGGEITLPVTAAEDEKLSNGKPIMYTLSHPKINHIKGEKNGGVLPLLALLPAIFGGLAAAGGVAGAATGIANAVHKKRADDQAHQLAVENSAAQQQLAIQAQHAAEKQQEAMLAEQKRQNQVLEAQRLGSGIGKELHKVIRRAVRNATEKLEPDEEDLAESSITNVAKDLPFEINGDGFSIKEILRNFEG